MSPREGDKGRHPHHKWKCVSWKTPHLPSYFQKCFLVPLLFVYTKNNQLQVEKLRWNNFKHQKLNNQCGLNTPNSKNSNSKMLQNPKLSKHQHDITSGKFHKTSYDKIQSNAGTLPIHKTIFRLFISGMYKTQMNLTFRFGFHSQDVLSYMCKYSKIQKPQIWHTSGP